MNHVRIFVLCALAALRICHGGEQKPLEFKAEVAKVEATRDPLVAGASNLTITIRLSNFSETPAGIDRKTDVLRALDAKGEPLKGEGFESRGVTPGDTGEVSIRLTVPAGIQSLKEIECKTHGHFNAERETLSWPLDKLAGQTQKVAGFEFTPLKIDSEGDKTTIETLYTEPPAAPYGLSNAAFSLVCTDGARIARGTGHGGIEMLKHQDSSEFYTKGKTPEKFEITFVKKATPRELRFTLKDIKLPASGIVNGRNPDIPIGPRGEYETVTDGFKFKIQSIYPYWRQSREQSGVSIELKVTPPEKMPIAMGSIHVADTRAMDEKENELSKTPVSAPYFDTHAYAVASTRTHISLAFPNPDADRLIRLAGNFEAYIATRTTTQEFDLPAGKQKLAEAVTKGTATLKSCEYAGDKAYLKFTLVSADLLVSPHQTCVVRAKLFDSEGRELKELRTDIEPARPGALEISGVAQFEIGKRIPAKCALHYVSEAELKKIPFEFKDIGLPRKMGLVSGDELQREAEAVRSGMVQKPRGPNDSAIHVKGVSINTRNSTFRENEIEVELRVDFDGLAAKPDGMNTRGRVIRAKTDKGKFVVGGPVIGIHLPPESWATFAFNVPMDVEKLEEIVCAIPVFFATDRQTLTWKLDKLRGETQKYGEWQFTPAKSELDDKGQSIEMHYSYPENCFSGQHWVKFGLQDKNGAAIPSNGGGGGGLGKNSYKLTQRFNVAGREPAVFTASFVAAARCEELTFTLQNVSLPKKKTYRDPSIPKGPRGSNSTEVGGWTLAIKSIQLEHSKEPFMNVSIFATSPEMSKALEHTAELKPTKAIDDLGNVLADAGRHSPYSTDFWGLKDRGKYPLRTGFTLSFPAEKADRIAELSGSMKIILEEESRTIEVPLPPRREEVKDPIKSGPLTVVSLIYNGDVATMKVTLDQSVTPPRPTGMVTYSATLLESNGEEIKWGGASGGGMHEDKTKPVEIELTYRLNEKTPAKLSFWYVNKTTTKELPFVFKDIGLPRKEGKWDVDNLKF